MGASRSGIWKYVTVLSGIMFWHCGFWNCVAVVAQYVPSSQPPMRVQTEQQLREIKELVQRYQSYQSAPPQSASPFDAAQASSWQQPVRYGTVSYHQDPAAGNQDFDPSPQPPVDDSIRLQRQVPQQTPPRRPPVELIPREPANGLQGSPELQNLDVRPSRMPDTDWRSPDFVPSELSPNMAPPRPPSREMQPRQEIQPQQTPLHDPYNEMDFPAVDVYPPGAVLPSRSTSPSWQAGGGQPQHPRSEIQPQPYQNLNPQYGAGNHPHPTSPSWQHHPNHPNQVGAAGAYFDQRDHQPDYWGVAGVHEVSPGCGIDCGFECGDPVFYLTGYGSAVDLRTMVSGDNTLETDSGGGFGLALGRWQGRNLRTEIEYGFRSNRLLSLETATDFEWLNGKIKSQAGMANAYWEFSRFRLNRLKPYVGAGLGFAILETDLARPGAISLTPERLRESSFAWQFMGGVSLKTQRNFDLFVEYRLFQADSFRIDTTSGAGDGSYDYRTNNLVGGLNWKF